MCEQLCGDDHHLMHAWPLSLCLLTGTGYDRGKRFSISALAVLSVHESVDVS